MVLLVCSFVMAWGLLLRISNAFAFLHRKTMDKRHDSRRKILREIMPTHIKLTMKLTHVLALLARQTSSPSSL